MVKHGKNKKRRAGRIGKTKLKNRSYSKFKPPQFSNQVVAAQWDPLKSPSFNLQTMGLQAHPNDMGGIKSRTTKDVFPKKNVIELFDIPTEPDAVVKNPRMSTELQNYMANCMRKHGDDYRAMFKDTKDVNKMQYTEDKLKTMGMQFLSLEKEYRRVEVPSSLLK